MNEVNACPVCENMDGQPVRWAHVPGYDQYEIVCEACGTYRISRSAAVDRNRLTEGQRRAVSHELRWQEALLSEHGCLTTASIEHYEKNARLPSISQQADNALRYLALVLGHPGRTYRRNDPALTSAMGAIDAAAANAILSELVSRGLVTGRDASSTTGPAMIHIGLTLEGWIRAGELNSGAESENFAFLAMKYGEPALDACVLHSLRPAVEAAGYQLEILNERPVAGIIDNYLRSRIRLCKFLIADLTHANNGAYWEAGFAEGLGKPVIYTCERSVFEQAKTHFDTNHSLTVVWSSEDPAEAHRQLLACIQNTFSHRR